MSDIEYKIIVTVALVVVISFIVCVGAGVITMLLH